VEDISAFGIRVRLVASTTFPAGITLTQFADDGDSLDVPSQQIMDKAMGVNGDLIAWSKANPINLTMNLIPNSADDQNMAVLLEANRVGRGKRSARDKLTLTAVYPDGKTITWSEGVITDGIPGNALASSGRMKTKPYMFSFEQLARSARA
jgi:hypothetical protein